ASFNWIGVNPNVGKAQDQGNVISGNGIVGVHIVSGDRNDVAGNELGTDATGTLSLPNALFGIDLSNASNNTIGGTTAAVGNLITDKGGRGIVVLGPPTGDQIPANRIFGNKGQAIDLGDDGVTKNYSSPRRGLGPNTPQNSPIIVATADGQLQGWLGGST